MPNLCWPCLNSLHFSFALWQEEQERQKQSSRCCGFTTVVRKRSAGQEGDGPNRKRKKKNTSLQNFYRFQMRETKRERECWLLGWP